MPVVYAIAVQAMVMAMMVNDNVYMVMPVAMVLSL